MAFSGTQQKCKACDKTVYVINQLTADGVAYHQACFRCSHCKRTLTLSDYSSFEGVPYCKPHFEQLFKMTGSFKKSFESNAAKPKEGDLQRTPSKGGSFKFTGTQEKCVSCGKTVYPLEKVSVESMLYHKSCFKCLQGGCSISPSNYAALEGRLYCKHHFTQLFKEKGNYSQLLVKMPSVKQPASTDA
eukprot:c11223_g2_i1 orf=38-601(-)